MEEDTYRSQFRMPYSLYELLKASADNNRRSVNAELIARLESTFTKKDLVRLRLGLPAFGVEDEDERPTSQIGIDKQALIASTLAGVGVSREDLLDAVSSAIESALSGLGAFPPALDNAKPQPNSGPRPRKPHTKK